MNGIRVVTEGRRAEGGHHDGAGVGRHASCSTTTSSRSNRDRARSGGSRAAATSRSATTTIPVKTAETFVTDAHGRRWSIPGDFATVEADGRITLLGRGSVSINSGGEKIYPEEVEGALEVAPRRVRRARRRRARRTLGRTRHRAVAAARRARRRRSTSCRSTAAARIAGYKVPRAAVPRRRGAPPAERQARLPRRERRAPAISRIGAGRVGFLRESTHGELGGTGLRGWLRIPPPTPRTCSG